MSEHRAYFVEDEDGHVHSFIGSVGDALAASGILFMRDGHWRIRNKDVDIVERKRRDLAVCDFCSARPVTFDIAADDFEDPWGNHSVAGWAACATCGALVQAGDRDGLRQRVLTAHARLAQQGFIRDMLIEQQRLFWHHYKGITPIAPKPFGH